MEIIKECANIYFGYIKWGNMEMNYIIMGILAFVFFAVYDINSIIFKKKLLYCSFFAGFSLLTCATFGIIITSWDMTYIHNLRLGIFGIIAVIFLVLLIYTLFFALPFKDTYIETEKKPKVFQNGVYALCRHPGVLWFIGFYAFLGLALDMPLLQKAAAIFSFLNILYVILQDRWTFIKSFENYDQYKIETPFLLPNLKSIKRCFKTLSRKEGTVA